VYIFSVAILIGLVIRLFCNLGIYLYLRSNKTEEEIRKKLGFQTLVVVYVFNKILLIIHGTILAALAVRTYLL
jgi:hypothetical protein